MVGLLGVEVPERTAEHGRFAGAGGPFGLAVGPAEPVVVQESAYLLITGHQPSRISDGGADGVDGPLCLQPTQQGRGLHRIGLRKR
jgi:hypothetical protein